MKNLKSFGKALYEFRSSKDISLEKISQITNISSEYFEAFEKGDFSINTEVYIRLFLIEYIKCIDATQIDTIMNKFEKSYNGKTNQSKLTFIPTSSDSKDSDQNLYTTNIFDNKSYSPSKIALVIFTFILIVIIFRVVAQLS